ncbi:glyoxalase superfamily protein [Shimia sp.]|jgi:hypothetical protein|uniref:glyoxalase superfamily protein n=1 Tax=unclassified Shimia TaxID=2630038 RepID=UPI003448646F
MRDFRDAKSMAKSLRTALAETGVDVSHSTALELVAKQFDLPDWNVLSAKIAEAGAAVNIRPAIPIIRSFDESKAREFYIDYLGFTVDWEHRHEEGLPLYMQVSRSDCLLHISGHHNDATPGGRSFVPMHRIEDFHKELQSRDYPNLNPGLESMPWGAQVTVSDPFGNKLTFCEQRSGNG